jgi:hypothetical protein
MYKLKKEASMEVKRQRWLNLTNPTGFYEPLITENDIANNVIKSIPQPTKYKDKWAVILFASSGTQG